MSKPLLLNELRARFWWGLGFVAAVMLYWAAGARGVPYLAETRWLPALARETGLDLSLARLEFDPFGPGVHLTGLTLKDREGHLLLTARGLRAKLDTWASLRTGRPALAVELEAPDLALTRDARGRWNWQEALPARGEESKPPGLPVSLARLMLGEGRLQLSDGLAAKPPMTATLEELHLDLKGLTGAPDERAPVQFGLSGPDGEQVTLTGEMSLNPLRLSGSAALNRLNLPFWTRLLKSDLPWQVDGGRLTARLDFSYPAAAPQGFTLEAEALELTGLTLTNRAASERRIGIQRLTLNRLRLGAEAPSLTLTGLRLAKGSSPWGQVDGLGAGQLTTDLTHPGFTLDTLTLDTLESTAGVAEKLTAGTVSLEADPPRLRVERLAAERLATPWGTLTSLSLAGMEYGWQDRALTCARLAAAQADSRWGRLQEPVLTEVRFAPAAGLSLATAAARRLEGPWGQYAEPRLGRSEYRPADRRLLATAVDLSQAATPWGQTAGLAVRNLDLALEGPALALGELAVTGADLPQGQASSAAASELRYSGKDQTVSAAAGFLERARTPDVQVERLDWEGLSYALKNRRWRVAMVQATDAISRGPIEPVPPGQPEAVTATPRSGEAGAQGEAASEPDPYTPRPARLGRLRLEQAVAELNAHRVSVQRVSADAAELDVIRRKDRRLTLRGLPRPGGQAAADSPGKTAWTVNFAEGQVEKHSIHFFDETTDPPVRLRFNGLSLKIFDLDDDPRGDAEFRLRSQIGSSSRIELEGRLNLSPLRTSFRFGLDKLRMRSVEPYWKPLTNTDLQRGSLSLWGDVVIRGGSRLKLDYAGGAEILDFDTVDRGQRQPVLKWDKLKFDGLAISTQPPRFVTRILTADRPYAHVALDEKRRLNLRTAFEPPSQAAIPRELEALQVEETPRDQLPAASIGLLRIKDGIVNFSDRGMQPGFAADIRKFNGSISGLNSRIDALATWVLDGRLNGNLPVHVFGEVEPMDYRDRADLAMSFKGLNLTTFSSYSGKFGGYRIEKGKLDMDLRYRINQGQVEAENRVLLDKLTLGERVDDSGSWLVDLAIMLLKGSDGKIDINLPINGDLSNPQFSLWLLYRDVLTGLLTKFVYSPASLVEAALDDGEVTPYSVTFAPGESEVSEATGALLATLAATMKTRPGANLDIQGGVDPRQDRLALAEKALLERLKADRRVELRAQGVRLHGGPVPDLSEEDYRRLFTAYYRKQHPQAPELRELKGGNALLSGHPYVAARNKALWEWPIDTTTLRALAQARAESLRGHLIDIEGIPDQDIFLLEVKEQEQPGPAIPSALLLAGS